MLHAITPSNRHDKKDLLDAMFHMRDDVVRNHWGWRVPETKPGDDRDRFDREDTIYFVRTRGDLVLGCGRLNSTTRPHLLSDVFPHCIEPGKLVQDERAFEFSRYVIDKKRKDFRLTMGWIELAINEAGLMAGVTRVSWLSYMHMLAHAKSAWSTVSLGLPTYFPDDDETYVAAVSKLDERGRDNLLTMYRFNEAKHDAIKQVAAEVVPDLQAIIAETSAPAREAA